LGRTPPAHGEGARYNVIGGNNATPGGACSGDCNLISGNGTGDTDAGVYIEGSDTMSNTVSGNYIGTNISGTAALSNIGNGVSIGGGAQYNVIGGDTAGERNLISGHNNYGMMDGIVISDNGTMSNTVKGNYIGTDVSGTSALPNGCGVDILHASGNIVSDNLISGNGNGVTIRRSEAMNNTLSGNKIGTDASGTFALPNWASFGVFIRQGTSHNTISNNLISGNSGTGVGIVEVGTSNNRVIGNYIGTDISGTSPISNAGSGVLIAGGAQYNVIGGDTAGERNLISGNGNDGVFISNMGNATINNTITQNSIYDHPGKGIELSDGGNLELFPPILTDVSTNTVEGQAPPDSTVEIFSDADDEGRYFHGSTVADASGNFAFTQASAFTGTNVTATATDGDGNTSEFSTPYEPLVDVQVIAILQPKSSGKQGQTVTPTVKIGNAGTTTESSIEVSVEATGDALSSVYTDAQTNVSLPPLGYATFNFSPFIPAFTGTYHFTATATLGGDQNASNDVLTTQVTVTYDNIDLWTRDHESDVGNVPAYPFWQSPDTWVRNADDDDTQHQDPIAGQENWVYMIVRNRGSAPSHGADTAKVYWHEPSLGIKCGAWAPIGTQTIASTSANTGTQWLKFSWTPTRTGHTCLFSEIVSDDDPVMNPCDIPWDNNLSQRNVDIIPGGAGISGQGIGAQALGGMVFEVTNIKDAPKAVAIIVDTSNVTDTHAVRLDLGSDLAARWASVDGLSKSSNIAWTGGSLITVTSASSGTVAGIPMDAGETQTVTLLVDAPSVETATVSVYEAIDAGPGIPWIDAIVGGNTYVFSTEANDIYLPIILKNY
jgi:parallel beta-helix repeat protein